MKNFTVIQKILVLSLVLALCASTFEGVKARQTADVPGPLQVMINNAPDGGTVNIPAGTYSETLMVDKNLTLIGASASSTILQPAGVNQRVINVTSGHNLTVEHLRVTGGYLSAESGGGIYLAGGNLILNTVTVDLNQGVYGGGIFQAGASGTVTVNNSVISDNSAIIHGGGLYTAGSATLTNTTLAYNTAGNHGGGLHVNSGTASLTGGAVYGNRALNGNGGGVNVNDGLTVVGTNFYDNTAAGTDGNVGSGGAVSQWNADKTVSISGATFNANLASLNGGAVYIQSSFLTLSATTFTENQVGPGGWEDDTYGGGVFAGGGLDGSHLSFTSNSAKCNECSMISGGGLYIQRPSTGASSINSSTFDGNSAWSGSAIGSASTVQLTLTDSAFFNNGTQISGPNSGYGGGVQANWVQGDQLLFQNNRVMNSGAGIFASHIILTNSSFINNTAGLSGGGGIFANNDFTGTNLVFGGNDSSNGAAIFVNTGPAVLKHITIGRPARGSGSGVFVNAGGTLELKNSILSAYDNGIRALGTVTEDYNLFFNNWVDYNSTGGGTINYGVNNLALKDPLFAAPAAGDYHLLWHSPAIGLGTNLGVTSDLDGRLRASRWDSGAYQYYAMIYLPLISK